jgi:hypothetical protein
MSVHVRLLVLKSAHKKDKDSMNELQMSVNIKKYPPLVLQLNNA